MGTLERQKRDPTRQGRPQQVQIAVVVGHPAKIVLPPRAAVWYRHHPMKRTVILSDKAEARVQRIRAACVGGQPLGDFSARWPGSISQAVNAMIETPSDAEFERQIRLIEVGQATRAADGRGQLAQRIER